MNNNWFFNRKSALLSKTQQLQRSFLKWFDRLILSQLWSRILFASIAAYLTMFFFRLVDVLAGRDTFLCSVQSLSLECLGVELTSIMTLENLQNYSVLLIAILYVLEGSDRKRQSHYEAWQILDAAVDIETSYARFKALQDLNKDGISLRGIDLPGADLNGIDLYKADLREATLTNCQLKGVDLRGADLRGADLRGAILTKGSKFDSTENAWKERNNQSNSSTDLQEQFRSQWKDNHIEEVDIVRATNLTGADLRGADLRGADLTDAILDYACLQNTRIDKTTKISSKWLLVWQLLNRQYQANYVRNKDFKRAWLRGISLDWADLEEADFSGADLTEANFTRSRLIRANLSKADLTKTNFTRAKLIGAILEGAMTVGSNFKDADLTDAVFDEAQIQGSYFSNEKSLVRARSRRQSASSKAKSRRFSTKDSSIKKRREFRSSRFR